MNYVEYALELVCVRASERRILPSLRRVAARVLALPLLKPKFTEL
jgi:hypothetical protein